jgi:hypothetical protein
MQTVLSSWEFLIGGLNNGDNHFFLAIILSQTQGKRMDLFLTWIKRRW